MPNFLKRYKYFASYGGEFSRIDKIKSISDIEDIERQILTKSSGLKWVNVTNYQLLRRE